MFASLVLLCLVGTGQAQEVVCSIPIGDRRVTAIRGLELGDSVFISFTHAAPVTERYNEHEESYWLSPSGRINRVDLPEMKDHVLAAVTGSGYYYFFGQDKKSTFLRCIKIDSLTGQKSLLPGQLVIPGRILASLVDQDLYLMWVEKENYVIKIVRLREMEIIEEKQFSLSFPAFKSNSDYVPFVDMERSPRIEDFPHKTKVFKQGREIHMVWDDRGDGLETEKRTFKTTVCKLDLETGKVSNKAFFCDHWNFSSTVIDNYLVRSVVGKEVQFYNLSLNKLEYTMPYVDEKQKGAFLYYRIGRNRAVRMEDSKYAPGGHLLGIRRGGEGDFSMIVGGSTIDKVHVPLVVVPVTLIITPSMNVPLRNLVEEGYTSVYGYYRGDFTTGFKIDPNPGWVRKAIDDHEIAQIKNGTRYEKKAYLPVEDGVVAIYHERDAKELKIIMFKHPQPAAIK